MGHKKLLINIFLLSFWVFLAYLLPYYLFIFKYFENYFMVDFKKIGAIFLIVLVILAIINSLLLLREIKKLIKEFL